MMVGGRVSWMASRVSFLETMLNLVSKGRMVPRFHMFVADFIQIVLYAMLYSTSCRDLFVLSEVQSAKEKSNSVNEFIILIYHVLNDTFFIKLPFT